MTVIAFEPHPLLRNAHLMTMAGALVRRKFPRLGPVTERLFEVEPGTRILAHCHWQAEPRRHPTLALVHGLEGSSESNYMLGAGEKAFAAGFNVLRLNQRNCGGTEELTPTLYNSGLSDDYRAVLLELIEQDRLPEVFFGGYSMGGNLVLKMAGEFGEAAPPALRGVAAVCPALDLAACAAALEWRQNFIYEWRFVRGLKARMRRKAQLYPERYSLNGLDRVRSVREFDEVITAPNCGYRDADDYYFRASAIRVTDRIRVPTLVLTAQDDPFVPYDVFEKAAIGGNPAIQFEAPAHGGHCSFISNVDGDNRFWAEKRVVEFCRANSAIV
jgi:hypothetical protein